MDVHVFLRGKKGTAGGKTKATGSVHKLKIWKGKIELYKAAGPCHLWEEESGKQCLFLTSPERCFFHVFSMAKGGPSGGETAWRAWRDSERCQKVPWV